ncbi:hypothetical protein GCM10010495_73730 [Kitasatospora herbaricolor]|nr:hexosaminidase [Kitasatospora herbaricolor]GGV45434.1 hypothetical protein GCM10010495_73730 [Kitasatospora herbaricolor]
MAAGLATDLATVTGQPHAVTHSQAQPGDIVLSLASTSGAGAEGYRLAIGATAQITANTSAGVYYGGRTLLQILRQDPSHAALPVGSTTDTPAKPMRVVMLDMGRKYWQPSYVKDLIRQMGWVKSNVLVMHFDDAEGFRLNSPAFPGLADPASSYTQAQIQEFQQVAAENNVTIMPGFEFPGHASAVADYFHVGFGDGPNADGSGATSANSCGQQYTYGWVTPSFTMNLTNPRSLQVSKQLLDTFLPWFNGPYVQLGGDEVPGGLAGCPAVQSYLTANSATYSTLGDLLSGFINNVNDHVKTTKPGSRSVIFNGFEAMNHPKQSVNTDVIVMQWDSDGATSAALAGYDTIEADQHNLYLTPNNYHRLYPNQSWIYQQWAPSTSAKSLGGALSLWDDYNMWAQDQFYEDLARTPRAMVADRMWNTSLPTDTVPAFQSRLSAIGNAPGIIGFPPPTRAGNGKPIHLYPMDPAPYPSGWHDAAPPPNVRPFLDTVGGLHGSSYILSSPSFVSDGAGGKAAHFSGSGDGIGLGGVDIAEPWTYSVWVRPTGTQSDAALLSSTAGAIKLQQFGTQAKVGLTRFGVGDYSFNYTAPLNQWVQLTFVATPGTTTLYANGQQVGQLAVSIPLPMQAVGESNRTTLVGDLDTMAIYDQALTAAQVTAQYLAPVQVPLTAYVNNDGISPAGAHDGNFDGSGYTYPADALPQPGLTTVAGTPFLFPDTAAGRNNNVVALGQTITTAQRRYSNARLLVASSYGATSGTVTFTYTDGTTGTAPLSAADWYAANGQLTAPKRYTPTGGTDNSSVSMYTVSLTPDPQRALASIKLPTTAQAAPSTPSMHAFALTLTPAP